MIEEFIINTFISSIPTYVWVGLALILVGVLLSVIPFFPRKYGAITFISGIILIAGVSLFLDSWNNNETFRIIFVSSLFFIGVMIILFTGNEVKR